MRRISDSCEQCLREKQRALCADSAYLDRVETLLRERADADTAPLLVYRFGQAYEELYGKRPSMAEKKKRFNDLVLSMEEGLRRRIRTSKDPLKTALLMARAGNYIDFGALADVREETFLALFDGLFMKQRDERTYESFVRACERGKSFLLAADNCGEIVLDKLLLEELERRFPQMEKRVLVRGGEVLNDATRADAEYAGISQVAEILESGNCVAGTVPQMLPEEVRHVLYGSDVILSKGQGNYESLSGEGLHVFYLLLCKCELFCTRFGEELLGGVFVEEGGDPKGA